MKQLAYLVIAVAILCTSLVGCGSTTVAPKTFTTTKTGLQYQDSVVGTGPKTEYGNKLRVDYEGRLDNGDLFDSSYEFGSPYTFTLAVGQVIPGWDEGLLGVPVGTIRKLIIPPTLAYGDRVTTGGKIPIPKNSTLHFTVHILSAQ